MRVRDLNWLQLQEYLTRDDRIVLPVGSTEQHAYLSLETDNIIAERLAVEAAEGLGVPVLPVLAYGVTGFVAYPGSPSLTPDTFASVVREILDSLHAQGFRRFLVANGHSGNPPEHPAISGWNASHPDGELLWHEVWDGPPDVLAAEIDADFDHASWSENFPWTRLPGCRARARGSLRWCRRRSTPPRRGARRSGTARSAACTSGRTQTRCECGTPPSSSYANAWSTAGRGLAGVARSLRARACRSCRRRPACRSSSRRGTSAGARSRSRASTCPGRPGPGSPAGCGRRRRRPRRSARPRCPPASAPS